MDGYRALAIRVVGRAMQDVGGKGLYMGDCKSKWVKGTRMWPDDIAHDAEVWLTESKQCETILSCLGYPWSKMKAGVLAEAAKRPDFNWRSFSHQLSNLMM